MLACRPLVLVLAAVQVLAVLTGLDLSCPGIMPLSFLRFTLISDLTPMHFYDGENSILSIILSGICLPILGSVLIISVIFTA
jgi:hypothetical protein